LANQKNANRTFNKYLIVPKEQLLYESFNFLLATHKAIFINGIRTKITVLSCYDIWRWNAILWIGHKIITKFNFPIFHFYDDELSKLTCLLKSRYKFPY
jgi:hypothetical protein